MLDIDLIEWKEVDTGKAQSLFHTFPVINIFREEKSEPEERRTKAEEDQLLAGKTGRIYDAAPSVEPEVKRKAEQEGAVFAAEEEGKEADFSLVMDDDGACLELALATGQVGLKPTAGLVSRYGMRRRTPSLERVSLLAKDAEGCARTLEAIAGVDAKDPMSRDAYLYDYTQALEADLTGFKLGILGNPEEIREEQRQGFDEMLQILADKGASFETVSLDWEEYMEAVDTYLYAAERRMTARAEMLDSNHEEREDMALGDWVLQEDHYEEVYLKALKFRSLIKDSYDLFFREYDLLAVPYAEEEEDAPYNRYLLGANFAGIPMMAVPKKDGTQSGLYLIAGANGESKLIRAAYTYEQGVR